MHRLHYFNFISSSFFNNAEQIKKMIIYAIDEAIVDLQELTKSQHWALPRLLPTGRQTTQIQQQHIFLFSFRFPYVHTLPSPCCHGCTKGYRQQFSRSCHWNKIKGLIMSTSPLCSCLVFMEFFYLHSCSWVLFEENNACITSAYCFIFGWPLHGHGKM